MLGAVLAHAGQVDDAGAARAASPPPFVGSESIRWQASGVVETELHLLPDRATGLLYTERSALVAPRFSLFLETQVGERLQGFAQLKIDRGFDPGDESFEARIDEFALRYTLGSDRRWAVQAGQFATVFGNWVERHASWENPFVTAPLPYENLTSVWDSSAAPDLDTLLRWGSVRPPRKPTLADRRLQNPVIWGPSYAFGAGLLGSFQHWDYAVTVGQTALSSRPDAWGLRWNEDAWEHPTLTSRLTYRPTPRWTVGTSASRGAYLRPGATLPQARETSRGDFVQTTVGLDAAYAAKRWVVWTEVIGARFSHPFLPDLQTWSYYVETRVTLAPRLFGALRWGEQRFERITASGGERLPWSRDVERLDLAATFRWTADAQIKVHVGLQREDPAERAWVRTWALQVVQRF